MRWTLIAALVLLAGCGDLPASGDGIVALEVVQPTSLSLEEGASRQLTARAFNAKGEEVATDIRWQTPDETVHVEELTGVVTALVPAGTGRVQAMAGTLRSDLITFTLLPATAPVP